MDVLLSKQFLQDIGVSLDEQAYRALSQHYEETLNERVITEVVDGLDEVQLEHLQALKDAELNILRDWLVANVPDLSQIIEDEVAILLGELAENSDKL